MCKYSILPYTFWKQVSSEGWKENVLFSALYLQAIVAENPPLFLCYGYAFHLAKFLLVSTVEPVPYKPLSSNIRCIQIPSMCKVPCIKIIGNI
jgi:hypothetical protein